MKVFGKSVVSALMLMMSVLFRVGTVFRLERDAQPMVSCLRPATNEYAPPSPFHVVWIW